MARPKKIVRAKEPVSLRFKELSKGGKSLYLDIYRNGVRKYEFLKLYLIPERPGVEADKVANRITLDAANAIKAQRTKEIVTGEAGIREQRGKSVLLTEWMEQTASRAGAARANTIRTALEHVARYMESQHRGRAVYLADIDRDFCAGFAAYLVTARKRWGGTIMPSSGELYFSAFKCSISDAHKKGLIKADPTAFLEDAEKPKGLQAERDYLTEDELRAMAAAPCKSAAVKSAFLFSCLCGLRLSDIESLKWGEIRKDGDTWRIGKRMQKTKLVIYLPLSASAVRCLPDGSGKSGDGLVFNLPPRTTIANYMRAWVAEAGINKRITFHCARHTFATLALTRGADLYSISKLLGHTDVKTTQVYAAIVDQRKQDAVDLLNGIVD